MAEDIEIVVEPREEYGGFLTVQDALHQVLDFVDILVSVTNEDVRSKIRWQLMSASTNSPFTAVAEAVSSDPEQPNIDQEVRQAKSRAEKVLRDVLETGEVPEWVPPDTTNKIKSFLGRNTNGVAKTNIHLRQDDPPLVIAERQASNALLSIGKNSAVTVEAVPHLRDVNWLGNELGTVEGVVFSTTTYYKQPAFTLIDRVSGGKVTCIIPADKVDAIGEEHSWKEVWDDQRYIVSGKIKRKRDGSILTIMVDEIVPVNVSPVSIDLISDDNFTGGQSPAEYLKEFWGE